MTALVISRASEHVVSARQIHAKAVTSLLRWHHFGQPSTRMPWPPMLVFMYSADGRGVSLTEIDFN